MTNVLSIAALNRKLDLYLPVAGDIGYWCLLNDTFTTALSFTVDAATDLLITSATHNLVTGTRIRLMVSGSGAVLPSVSGIPETTFLTTRDYFVIRISATTLELANTQALAIAATPINITSSGSGAFTLSEQPLIVSDPIAVLINHELNPSTHLDYVRRLWTASGASVAGAKPVFSWSQIVNPTRSIPLTYRYKFLIKGGISTVGDVTGEDSYLVTEQATVSIPIGQQGNISVTVAESNQS